MTPLIPLHQHPQAYPEAWATVEAAAVGATVLLDVDTGPGTQLDPTWATSAQRLVRAGVDLIGYVDLGFGGRPPARVRGEIARWSGYPVRGIFFDNTPTSPYSIGPVATAVRSARRLGYDTLLLNPGRDTDSIYRGLGTVMCTFDGHWDDYRSGTGEGVRHGDAHLVHGVPAHDVAACYELMRGRGARFGLATTEPARRVARSTAGLPVG